MASFQVTTQLLNDKAGTIGNINERFLSIMADITRLMHNLQDEWQSEASNQFVAKFDQLNNDFKQYSEVIASYQKFLTNAATDYTSADSAIKSATADLFS
ncbi:WXG100 family type VII secretion target [Vallitalea guaymasensis]|uniref:ESAT-6-like protein n=1 Tax=Vallitalea guaymasensis TaxID=1185412 RepID=A0A8J8SC60_9FIRM|nr:WXG100 family type VII secretion target [Vallitalea guaymasensis]QUH29096.1 WXG100 family type VII secretion target [Vallitalea guaymasensis]